MVKPYKAITQILILNYRLFYFDGFGYIGRDYLFEQINKVTFINYDSCFSFVIYLFRMFLNAFKIILTEFIGLTLIILAMQGCSYFFLKIPQKRFFVSRFFNSISLYLKISRIHRVGTYPISCAYV